VVGTGFLVAGQVTAEACAAMAGADRLLHLVSDTPTRLWLEGVNPHQESLEDAYGEGRLRTDSYEEMVARILAPMRAGARVCAAFYGHPGVFVYPSHEAIRRARGEGFRARMLPGVSAEDCLFADLGLDPAIHGCRSYEATDFLVRRQPVDPTTGLVLWQVGAIGVATYHRRSVWRTDGLRVLADRLLAHYPAHHRVTAYTAATLPVCAPGIARLPLAELPAAELSVAATLYVPPAAVPPADPAAVSRLGLAGAPEVPEAIC
jgi:uncharacterized protein YabN with tetrapyrrole methylase and pyrophosphatase domain